MNDYQLLDSGNLKKLEKFGPYKIIRPSLAAIWKPKLSKTNWEDADLIFERDTKNKWIYKSKKIDSWNIEIDKIRLNLRPTDFGHLGFFAEHLFLCNKLQSFIKRQKENGIKEINVLNLFAYSGLASMYALKKNAKVCHVDSSKPSILWAKKNAHLNNFKDRPIRYIQDDVLKFITRELKRGTKYDGIVLDPPSFGRGAKGEIFKIEDDIFEMLDICNKLLKNQKDSFIIFSTHSPGFTKVGIENLFRSVFENKFDKKSLYVDELLLESKTSYSIPSGYFAIWKN
jgi:23S rRNA (cytosine1962-C5)-methyltransferase